MTLIPFSYDGQEVRVVEINGEPWFVGTDVARVLGYANPSDALGRLDPDERAGERVLALAVEVAKLGRPVVAEAVS